MIKSKDDNVTQHYIGSTQNFHQRYLVHKHRCKKQCYGGKLYEYIRENGGWDAFTMVAIEYFVCNSLSELRKREGYFITLYQSPLNMRIAGRTRKEYEQLPQYKIYQKNYQKEWIKKNSNYRKDYYQKNKFRYQNKYKQKKACLQC